MSIQPCNFHTFANEKRTHSRHISPSIKYQSLQRRQEGKILIPKLWVGMYNAHDTYLTCYMMHLTKSRCITHHIISGENLMVYWWDQWLIIHFRDIFNPLSPPFIVSLNAKLVKRVGLVELTHITHNFWWDVLIFSIHFNPHNLSCLTHWVNFFFCIIFFFSHNTLNIWASFWPTYTYASKDTDKLGN